MKAEIQRKLSQIYYAVIGSKEFNRFTPFFNHGQVINGFAASFPVELVNALLFAYKIQEPITISHFLEIYGCSTMY